MEDVIDKIINIVKKNNIKIITIAESNHRSFTSHTFQYQLVKKLYEQKLINTFGSERLGIIDADIINWYLSKNKTPKNLIEKLPFGGMGYDRIIKYLSRQKSDSYEIVGLEEDEYCYEVFKKLPASFDLLSTNFLKQIQRGVVIGKLKPQTVNDKRWYKSLASFRVDNRESFWLNQIKKTLERRNNLFINGFHLGKNDKIGKWLSKNYKNQVLFLGMGAKNIKTQLLLIPSDVRNFDKAIIEKNYKQKITNIDNVCRPTALENSVKDNEWKLIKVDSNNQNQKVRAVGCYLAMYEKDYLDSQVVNIGFSIKKYDYVVIFDKNEFKNQMFY